MSKSGHNEMTAPPENNPFQIESRTAYAVYDSQSGAIAHIHVITAFRGAQALPEDKHEARAMEMAKRMGHNPERLRVVRVDHAALQHGTQRIDLKSLSLVADPELEARSAKKSRES